jgi:predicted ArsR family transcriptional regulator
MSSDGLEKSAAPSRGPGDRLLLVLKNRGPQTAARLGKALGTTGEAARQQLTRLASEGLVQATSRPCGVGRPAQVWALTSKGHGRFPDTHAELTVQIIESVRTTLGEQALDQLIAARERKMREAYGEALKGARRLEDRVARLAAIRNREGYMAEWKRSGNEYLLIENHCPICAAATACTGFCRSELELFSALLPGAKVTRVEHIVDGARRCAYLIAPRRASA